MQSLADLLAQYLEIVILFAAACLFLTVCYWKIFQKAGRPGWATLVPIYNLVVLIQIAKRPEWWIVLLFIPLLNIYAAVMIDLGVARQFGKSDGFGFGLLLLPIVFVPILAFSSAHYTDEEARVNQMA